MEKHDLQNRFDSVLEKINLPEKKELVASLEKKTYDPAFWNDHETAAETMKHISDIKKEIDDIEMIQLFLEEDELKDAETLIKKYEIMLFLSGDYDKNDAIVSIHAGAGGTEAMDWTDMLYRMYTRFIENKGWKYDQTDLVGGEEAGIKSVTIQIKGKYAYGLLKGEAGSHRLVRQSPFNADALRQTSFSLVEVLPIIEHSDIDIKEEDLEWQFYRSGGSGGQNVNKVSTAVRLTHIPSGIVVTCQTERQQGQNRETALKLLRAKLWHIEEEKKAKEIADFKTDTYASFGKQIRSYVLHPYKMVKDVRTNYETSQAEAVLDGDLDEFIEVFLRR